MDYRIAIKITHTVIWTTYSHKDNTYCHMDYR